MGDFKLANRVNGLTALAGAAAGTVLFSRPIGLAVGAGALLMAADVYWLSFLAGRLVAASPGRTAAMIALLLLKFVFLFGATGAALLYFRLDAYAFGGGVAAVVLTTTILLSLRQPRPEKAG